MPKVLPAVGLAVSALQPLEFAVRIFQKDHEVYQPRVGARVDNEHILRIVTHELYGLTEKIDEQRAPRSSIDKRGGKLEDATQLLLKLSDRAKEFTLQLIDGVEQAREKCIAGESIWTTPREALLIALDKGNLSAQKKRFLMLRKEIEVALLRALKCVRVRDSSDLN